MKRVLPILGVVFLLMSLNPVQAQTDTEFWFAVPRVTEGHGWDDNSFFFRFTNLDQPNQVFITMPANPDFDPIEVNMDPNEALTVDVTDQIQELWITNPDQVYNRGIQIIASELTTAYFEVGTFYNPDIFSLKGKNALGEEFFVPFQNRVENGDQYDPSPYSAIYIVATQDNTTITVTPTNDAFPGRPAGVPFDLVLDRGETIAVAPDDYAGDGQLPENRLGGTRVESDKPIAITTSDDSVYGITGCYDLIGDQIIPTSIIGTEYIAMKGELTAPEYFYVVGTQEGTEVLIDGNLEALIEPGEQLRWEFTKQNYHIETSKPAYVYHVAGFGCEQGGAVLPPIDVCTGSTSVSFTRSKGESFFLNILVRAGAQDGFIFNGDGPNTVIEAADFEAVPGSANWLAAEFEMTQAQVPVGEATLIENEKDVFHLGIINGGPSSGTMYGYFSDFNELDISANVSGTGSNHKACFGVPIQLEAFGGTEYQWHPPDYLDDPTSPTPIALPDSSIKYTVTVSGACQMVDSSSVFIHLHGPALAAFTIDEPAGCAPFDLVVNNESYGINHYSWSMGDGTVYTTGADYFTHTYHNTTDEVITREIMLVGRYSMCRDTMITSVDIYPEIHAQMEADIIEGCAPLEVNFDNYSTGAEYYEWKFGDGSSTDKSDPTHVFHNFSSEIKEYNVLLTAVSKYGCVSEDSVTIRVKPYIEAGFDFDPPQSCTPYPVQLQNTSFGATTNMWSFDGGENYQEINAAQFSYTFENEGTAPETHELWLRGENAFGCADSLSRELTVFPPVTSEFEADVVEGCNPLIVEFNNLSEGAAQYLWDFDGGEGTSSQDNPVVVFENQSDQDTLVFNVTLESTSDYMCKDFSSKEITVFPRIEAGFTFDYVSHCTPHEIVFDNHSKGVKNHYWDFGDGNTSQTDASQVTHLYENSTDEEKVYTVRLIVENAAGCLDTLEREVVIFPEVKADFETTLWGCHPLEVDFSNTSKGADAFFWDFGDGGNTQNENPSRVFTNTSHTQVQEYEVMLVAASDHGCIDTTYQTIEVHPRPHADYSLSESTACAPVYVDFTENAQGASQLFWQFGDGSDQVSTTGSVAHTYYNAQDESQTFTTRMIATNEYGCSDTLTQNIQIFPEIEASFDVSQVSGCHPLEVELTNTSWGASAQNPYLWTYGDGHTSGSQQEQQTRVYENTSHTEVQDFTIALEAHSLYGCVDTAEYTLSVYPRPAASFSQDVIEGCSPLEVNFDDASLGAQQYNWSFGDGEDSQQSGSAQHTYQQPWYEEAAILPVELYVENNWGCTDSAQSHVTVFPEIIADFEMISEGCHPLEVDYTNLSLGADDYLWSLGDGASSNAQDPAYEYTNESYTDIKNYEVALTATSLYGCQDSFNQQVTVFPKPKSDFSLNTNSGCSPLDVVIENLSVGGHGYQWVLGGSYSNTSSGTFSHEFSNLQHEPVEYDLHLTTTNEHGCYRESSQQVEVYPEVVAAFSADVDVMEGCSPLELQFENESERAHFYQWDFGDGNQSTQSSPKNQFFTPSSEHSEYTILLQAESVFGCEDTTTRNAKVHPKPVADMFILPYTQVYPNTQVRLDNLSSPGEWQFKWQMGDGTVIETESWDTIDHEYVWDGNDYSTRKYHVNLEVANEFCMDSISQVVTIEAPTPKVGFEPSKQGCPPLQIQFRNESDYGLEFFWDFDNGSYSHAENPSHVFHEPGEYMVKLLVSGEGGVDSAYQEITVFDMPVASFRVSPEEVQLPYESVQMINTSSMAAYYEWDMGDGNIYYDYAPEHKYEEPGEYDIRLRVATDTQPQCFDTLTKSGAVNAEDPCDIIFPNAFTPNTSGPSGGSYVVNDPANHVFYPLHTGVGEYELEIFNRWGEFLFRSTDLDIGWDGYYRGELAPMGVYVYKVRAKCHNGRTIEKVGDVTLYR